MNLTNTIKNTYSKTKFWTIKHLPEILTGAAVVGIGATIILAIKETRKADVVLKKHHEAMENIEIVHNNPELCEQENYTEDDYKKDITITYVQTVKDFTKLYLPTALTALATIFCICASTKILKTRNAALAAAYTALSSGFLEYRERVKERFGEDVEHELYFGESQKQIDAETNEETSVACKTNKKPTAIELYTRTFDYKNPNWIYNDPFMTGKWLEGQERYANDLLRANGYIFLSTVLKALGYKETPESRVVGWIYDKDDLTRDSRVSFGISQTSENYLKFADGTNNYIQLEFNVDGPILDLMP